jgi:hypothetical protein
MANKTEALYNALLPMKIAGFDDIMQAASSVIEGSANRKYIYRKYVKRLIEAHKLQAIRKGNAGPRGRVQSTSALNMWMLDE